MCKCACLQCASALPRILRITRKPPVLPGPSALPDPSALPEPHKKARCFVLIRLSFQIQGIPGKPDYSD